MPSQPFEPIRMEDHLKEVAGDHESPEARDAAGARPLRLIQGRCEEIERRIRDHAPIEEANRRDLEACRTHARALEVAHRTALAMIAKLEAQLGPEGDRVPAPPGPEGQEQDSGQDQGEGHPEVQEAPRLPDGTAGGQRAEGALDPATEKALDPSRRNLDDQGRTPSEGSFVLPGEHTGGY